MAKIIPLSIVIFLSLSFPVAATCPAKPEGQDFGVQPAWQQVFPFDLVYPTKDVDTDIDDLSNCPQFSFWERDFEMCSIPMVAGFVKNSVLLVLTYRWLTSG